MITFDLMPKNTVEMLYLKCIGTKITKANGLQVSIRGEFIVDNFNIINPLSTES